ncbi:CPBP family intramembrane metalloprotease [Kribbella sancticallisti]|uniref:CPBP family intramembrane metalloprotease n=1 Tax=Kribbella sancticallisti TaxID=460087 RepID=A0ABP4PM68_9ACTN
MTIEHATTYRPGGGPPPYLRPQAPWPHGTPPPVPSEQLTYERLARAGRHNWWRPVVGTFVLLGLSMAGMLLVYGLSDIAAEILGFPDDADGWPRFDDVTTLAIDLLGIAIVLPAVALTARWVQKRPWGTLTSVTGRLRLRWLGRCLAVAAATVVVTFAGFAALSSSVEEPGAPEEMFVGWGTFAAGLAVVLCLVPLQAAAEEYVFRGWLLQAAGAFFRSPILVLLPQAVLFAAVHGWGTPWGFADLTVFGLLAGWLTIRTGGIEAAIALHVMTNVVGMGMASAFVGGLASDETAADMPWSMAVVDMTIVAIFSVIILRLARRAP